MQRTSDIFFPRTFLPFLNLVHMRRWCWSVLRLVVCVVFAVAICAGRAATRASFEEELQIASQTLMGAAQKSEEEMNAGKVQAANERLLGIFPKGTRTPAQMLALGNMLYGIDAKLSYALHKQAAREVPREPLVQLEWAMEQHRAREYEGAVAAYEVFSKASPDFAPVHGLMADCLIRLGKTREAVVRWQQSERARTGTLERFEHLVCEVYKDPGQEERRAVLCAKALTNAEAAVELVAQDVNFELDWWIRGPHRRHLLYDVVLLRNFPRTPRVKAAHCAAELMLQKEPTAETVRQVLSRHGFLIDNEATLSADGALLSAMLAALIETELFSREEARRQFGGRIRELAKNSKDANLHTVVASLYIGTDEMASIEREAWEKTGDWRFAAGYLSEVLAKKALKADDPLLERALRDFPENSLVMVAAMRLKGVSDEKLLVQAIKAEYRHFSGERPSARLLREYFQVLARTLNEKGQLTRTNTN